MTTYFTSDLHLGHANIIDFCDRPFSSVAEMNTTLIANINETVDVDDTLIIEGDVCMGDRNVTLPLLNFIVCRNVILRPGNHDHCWPGGKRTWGDWLQVYEEFVTVELEKWPGAGIPLVLDDGTEILTSHFPYAGDSHDPDRYSAHRPFDDGVPLLHGHVHDAWKVALSPKGTPMVNVGVDVHNFFPVAIDDLVSLLDAADTLTHQ